MSTLKFRTLWGVCEFLQMSGLSEVTLKRVNGVWELSHNKDKLN